MRFLLEKLEDLRYEETSVSAISQIWEGIHNAITDAGDVYHMNLVNELVENGGIEACCEAMKRRGQDPLYYFGVCGLAIFLLSPQTKISEDRLNHLPEMEELESIFLTMKTMKSNEPLQDCFLMVFQLFVYYDLISHPHYKVDGLYV
jgi:hypothetical protein